MIVKNTATRWGALAQFPHWLIAAQSNTSAGLLCCSLLMAVAIGGCSHGAPGGRAPPATEVGVVTLQPKEVTIQSELSGRTVASLMSDVRPQISGIVEKRLFEEGAEVKAGQVLYQIEPSSYAAAVDQAQADLANAAAAVASVKLKDARYAELIDIQGISKQEADDAHASYLQGLANVELKKAALKSARINLGYTHVRAPISGRIGKSTVTAGALVTANQDTALATIRALDPMYVDLTQSSTQLLQLRKLLGTEGMTSGSRTVRLELEDGTEYGEKGTLKFQEVAVDPATGSVTLRAQFPNARGVLLPGMYVRAVLDEATNSAALLVPQQGITRDSKGQAIAMLVGQNDKVEQRTVVTARAVGNEWLITSGLNAGDRLIVEGLNKVHAGDTVRPVAFDTAVAQSGTSAGDGHRSGAGAHSAASAPARAPGSL
jgi:membrane fusion protein (multidrug efflux system)